MRDALSWPGWQIGAGLWPSSRRRVPALLLNAVSGIARGQHGPKAGHGAARVLLRYILPGRQIGVALTTLPTSPGPVVAGQDRTRPARAQRPGMGLTHAAAHIRSRPLGRVAAGL